MYSDAEIDKKIALARKLKLSGCQLLEDRERVSRVCNGIGAAWMPKWLRKFLGRMFPTLVLAADIHDIRYEIGGKKLNRLLDDVEMLDNGIRLANYSYRFFDPRRYVVQFVMLQFYIKLRDYGSLAFNTQEDENA